MTKKYFFLFGVLLFPHLAWARTDMTGYYEEKGGEFVKAAQQMNALVQQAQHLLKGLGTGPQKMAGGETYYHKMVDEFDLIARVNIRYYLERHEIAKTHDQNGGDNKTMLTDSTVILNMHRDFNGKLLKVYEINRAHPEKHHYHIQDMKGDKPDVKKVGYDYAMQTLPGGGKSHCHGEEWREEIGSIVANPFSETTGNDKRYHVHFDAGIDMEQADCFAYPVPTLKTGMLIAKDDFETLFKEGRWEKTFDQKYSIDFEADMMNLSWWAPVPLYSLVLTDPRNGGNYRDTQIQIELLLSPRIEGPHFAAVPKQTIDLLDNNITLKVNPVPGWQVSAIKPKEGWEKASHFFKKVSETSAPGPTLKLAPLEAGKVNFEVEWTSPKGKKGKSDPFEVTAVELKFKEAGKCNGFDELEALPVPGASICVDKNKSVELEALPKGVQVETKLEAADPNIFQITPQTIPGFSDAPQKITLRGLTPKKEVNLTAKIKIDKEEYQTAAQIITDTMRMREIKILPIFFNSDPQALAPPNIAGMFNQAKQDLAQTCLSLDVLPLETIKPKDVPTFTGGDTVRYDLNNWGPLNDYSRKPSNNSGQELTAIVVPFMARAIKDTNGNPTEELEANPLAFLDGDIIVVAQSSFPHYIHVMGHEIGHYIFKDIYISMEGDAHTEFNDMLMFYYSTEQCEVRQKEWRQISR